MIYSDFLFIFNWWFILFLIGALFLPLTIKIFSNFFDQGYIFSKTIGILLISYFVWFLGSLKILPFTHITIIFIFLLWGTVSLFVLVKVGPSRRSDLLKIPWKIWLFEELIFLTALFFWSYIRAHEPAIHGLEKYMDFSFVNSILRSDYFPPKDLWMTPLSINYYYFGHLVTAVLTKISGIDSTITFNLMVSTLFALTFTAAFSIGLNLFSQFKEKLKTKCLALRGASFAYTLYAIGAGLLTAFLVTLAGNLQTIYAFFAPYNPDHPIPFWQLPLQLNLSYWYPNATRFIPFTIHEFPIYSFVVSDLHGHVLSIPIVLTIIAILISLISKHEALNSKQIQNSNSQNFKQFRISNFGFRILLLALLLAVAYMTNVWDGIIYGILTLFIFAFLAYRSKNYTLYAIRYTLIILGSILFTLPFSFNFNPFVSGIGIICAPEFLTKLSQFGPFLFELDHCQRSAFWQLAILWGFFYFWVASFIFLNFGHWKLFRNSKLEIRNLSPSDIFILILIILSTLLIIIPEFIYVKDIYPAHYRANTMFKLTYQAFIMFGVTTGYIIVRLISRPPRSHSVTPRGRPNGLPRGGLSIVVFIGIIGLFLVSIYPFFAVNSYYAGLNNYQGLDGLTYLKNLYPQDYEGILWLRKNTKGQPVILEAQGDSYTDFARVSANTGLPTVIGWPVHEWLWRGSFDLATPRISDVQTLYETNDLNLTQGLIKKYNITFVFVGDLERQKYQNLFEEKFRELGKIVFENGSTRIYLIGQLPLSN